MPRIAVMVAVACALIAPASAAAADYVAMGDSYASGTGTRQYTNAACQRSAFAYPSLMQATFGTFSFVACSGAKTQNVLDSQVSALDAGTDYVTISIGGNDAGFGDVISACAAVQLP